jgi:uncharacterized protein (UPF0333 family)
MGQEKSGLVTWLIIAIGYLAWTNYSLKKEYKEDLAKYHEAVAKMQDLLNAKNGEEREMLLSVIDKYHQSQIGIKDAIGETKSVLATISRLGH